VAFHTTFFSVLNLKVFHLSSPSPVIVPFPFSADLSRDKNRGKEKKNEKEFGTAPPKSNRNIAAWVTGHERMKLWRLGTRR
jgi:hypothetical protein